MEEPRLASLSLTHVRYDPSDHYSYISAWLALAPQALCIIYVTLIWSTREVEVILMFAGQMASELLNFGLKRLIKEERPQQMHGKGYGMPSSHSQFISFFSTSLTLFLLLRHQPPTPTTRPLRLAVSLLSLTTATAVATSRIYLNYHTPRQVLAGVSAGVAFAGIWFGVCTGLRKRGWVEWGLEWGLVRWCRVRDLIVSEDVQDAGWEKWERVREARKARRGKGRVKAGKKE